MKTAILTCVNDRRHISPLIFECYKRLKKEFDVQLIVGYTSKEDEEMVVDWSVKDPGVHPVGPIENIPGKKWNTVLKYGIHSSSVFDKFLIMGDDDSIGTRLFEFMLSLDFDYYGTNLNAYIDCSSGQAMKHEYEMRNKLIGAGRMISRKALVQTCFRKRVIATLGFMAGSTKVNGGDELVLPVNVADYLIEYKQVKQVGDTMFVGLWPDGAKQSLDHKSELNLVMNGFVPVSINDGKIHVTDCKTMTGDKNHNIWSFGILERKCSPITFEEATWFMNESEIEILKQNRK